MRPPVDVRHSARRRRVYGRRDEAVGGGEDVTALDVRALRYGELRRLARVLAERKHDFIRIRHAPNRQVRPELLVLRRMDAVCEAEGSDVASRGLREADQNAW